MQCGPELLYVGEADDGLLKKYVSPANATTNNVKESFNVPSFKRDGESPLQEQIVATVSCEENFVRRRGHADNTLPYVQENLNKKE